MAHFVSSSYMHKRASMRIIDVRRNAFLKRIYNWAISSPARANTIVGDMCCSATLHRQSSFSEGGTKHFDVKNCEVVRSYSGPRYTGRLNFLDTFLFLVQFAKNSTGCSQRGGLIPLKPLFDWYSLRIPYVRNSSLIGQTARDWEKNKNVVFTGNYPGILWNYLRKKWNYFLRYKEF